ncbi:hypothetical protein ACFXHA_06795 [Nocardia sp. NPDC059240]|uniref:hypothetical protein n=1 Tax=Nocardia sp. NPDC059240 TaxID=3346786 RepID=UPI0036795369
MTNPSNPTVLDELRSSPIGPYLDTPVTDVLSNLGLPQLPQLPSISLPDLSGIQLPTLPTIDLTTLIQPVISMLQSFGTGTSSNSSFNPATIITDLISALTSATSQSKSATSTVLNTWTGDAAKAAEALSKTVEAQSGEVAAQGANQHGILITAQGVVATGNAQMVALIGDFITEVSGSIATLATPAGLPWLIATVIKTINLALGIVADTEAALAGPTADIAVAGTKIIIAGAPIAQNIGSLVSMVGTALQPITNALPTAAADVASKGATVVETGVKDISSALSSSNTNSNTNTNTNTDTTKKTTTPTVTTTKTDDEKKTETPDTTKTDGGGTSPVSTLLGGGVPSTTTPATTVGANRIPTGEVSTSGAGIPKTTTEANGRSTATTSPAMAGGAGAAGRAGAADEESTSDRSKLVTGAHGDEVVGVIEGVVLPVVGAIEAIEEPPDKALTL